MAWQRPAATDFAKKKTQHAMIGNDVPTRGSNLVPEESTSVVVSFAEGSEFARAPAASIKFIIARLAIAADERLRETETLIKGWRRHYRNTLRRRSVQQR